MAPPPGVDEDASAHLVHKLLGDREAESGSGRWGDDANSWILPGYGRLDAMAAYRMEVLGHKVTARLNVKNLSDTKYFEYSDAGTNAYYGAPRSFVGSLGFEF